MVCREPDRFDWNTPVVPFILYGLLGVESGHVSSHGVLGVEGSLGLLTVETLIFLTPVVDESPPAPREMFGESLLLVVVPPALSAPLLGLQQVSPAGLTRNISRYGLHKHRGARAGAFPGLTVLLVVVEPHGCVESFITFQTPELFLCLRTEALHGPGSINFLFKQTIRNFSSLALPSCCGIRHNLRFYRQTFSLCFLF